MNRWVPAQPLRWVGVAALLRGQPLGSIHRRLVLSLADQKLIELMNTLYH